MKLGEIRNYIKKRGTSSLIDVATHFDISQEAAKLAVACGSSCGGCGSASENYQWVNEEHPIHWIA